MISLGSKTAVKIWEILLDNPLQEFKEIELIKKAKTGKGSASKFIDRLISEGLLTGKRIGKTKLISLNFVHPQNFLLKNLFDQRKLSKLSKSKLSSVILFKGEAEKYASLIILFGSSVAGTAVEESDLDLLIVSNNFTKIERIRKKVEELLGERFNLHFYSKKEVMKKSKTDKFILNAFLKGVLLSGYDLGKELFVNLKEKSILEERLFYFHERAKSALRNYLNEDYASAREILATLMEQVIFYLLTEKKIPYTSKKDAQKAIKKLPEAKIILKINNSRLKQKISLMESFVQEIIKNKILEGEGHVKGN